MAIAFDATYRYSNSFSTTNPFQSWTHTGTAGSFAVVVIFQNTDNTDSISTVTWGGVSMTRSYTTPVAYSSATTDKRVYFFTLANITGGAQTVSVTNSSGKSLGCTSYTYTGVLNANPIDNTYTFNASASSSSYSTTLTTNYNGSLALVVFDEVSYMSTPPTGFVSRNSHTTISLNILDRVFTSSGSQSITATYSASTFYGSAYLVLRDATPPSTNSNFLAFF